MIQKKDYEDAALFLHFVKTVRESPDTNNIKLLNNFIEDPTANLQDDKYKCIYCGCEYVYRKSLISHLKRLHNIKNIE